MTKFIVAFMLIIITLSCSDNKRIDENFEEEMRSDSARLTQIKDPDSLAAFKLSIADKYYNYYTLNPASLTGEKAISASFKIWDYGSQFEKLRNAFMKIDVNDPLWSDLFGRYRMSFIMENKMEDFLKALKSFALEATKPISVNYIFRELGDDYYRTYKNSAERAYRDSAIICYQRVLHEEVVDEDVARSKKILYELDSLDIEKPFPNFIAEDIHGNSISTGDYSGKVLLIDFWATWCGPCIPEIPFFKALSEKYNEDQLVIIGISLDRDIEQLETFIKQKGMDWPQICDQQKWEGTLVNKYNGFRSIPKTFIVDRNGIIRYKDLRQEELVSAVSELVDHH